MSGDFMKGDFMKPVLKTLMLMASLTAGLTAQADDHEGGVTVHKVTDAIYMLQGNGGNIGVMTGADGTFAIDDQYAPETPAILKAIKSLGGDRPAFLINTHFHGDHTGGNENLGVAGALIMAHDNVRKRMAEGYEIAAFNMKVGPASAKALPLITFDHELGLHINGEHLRAHHVAAAHTDGDSIIVFQQANVIHAGDTFFNGFFPFIDVAHGGTLKGAIAAADRILAMADAQTRIIPGHGPLASREDLQRYRAMLALAYERLSALKQAGKSVAEAQAADPLADLQAQWGQVMFDASTWIGLIYDGLE